ncbi:hypothetical protein [Absidia glauca]|uniref:Uncharacterized protein n=1 Tax=Absidia glauca TaxID=4829 RepID=A0A163J064_ABSGL|nr:hypothetical protein [Absidia glauca]
MKMFKPIPVNNPVTSIDKIETVPKYPFFLGAKFEMDLVGQAIIKSKADIPIGHFDGSWDDIIKYPNGRAVDWISFVLFCGADPFCFFPSLQQLLRSHQQPHYRHEPLPRVESRRRRPHIHYIHYNTKVGRKVDNVNRHEEKKTFPSSDKREKEKFSLSAFESHLLLIFESRQSISAFQNFLFQAIQSGTRTCCTSNIHYLGHISMMIRRLGPLQTYSCRQLERTIGHYKHTVPVILHLYRHSYLNSTDNMKDIFDGKVYQALLADGKFESQYDIAIGLSIDGFTFFDGSNFQGTMVNMIIFNIHPKQRYKTYNMYGANRQ